MSFNNLKDEGVSAVCEAIQSNKETKLSSLNFGHNGVGPVEANAVAAMVAATGSLTSLDVRSNDIVGDGAAKLSAAVFGNLKIEMFNEIPIKEMRANSITELDLKGMGIGVEGGLVVAGLLPVMGSLTTINLSGNQLCGVWTDRYGDLRGDYTAEGITAIADALLVNGSLTSLSLAMNELGDDGAEALSIGLKENKSLTTLDLSGRGFGEGRIGPRGATALASAISVNGSLKVTNLLRNQLDAESAKMLAEVAKQKGISLCGIQRNQTTAVLSRQGLKPPDAILLASDLSQAGVTGSLTKMRYVTPELEPLGSDWTQRSKRDCLCTSLASSALV